MQFVKRYGWIAAVLIFFCLFMYQLNQKPPEESLQTVTRETIPSEGEKTEVKVMKVDVKGEVTNPGVYTVEEGMRVNDVVELAGGFTEQADPVSVNLAQKLTDEMVIHVRNKQTGQALPEQTKPAKIVINQATSEDLQTLSGIGPSKADAIIRYREENGLFQKVEDLLDVPGIGESTLNNLKDQIQIP